MKVLAFDPGYDRLGVAVLTRTKGEDTLLYSTCVETDKTQAFGKRLYTIGTIVESLMGEHSPDMVAIETLFFNKNVKTAIGVAQTRGVIVYLAERAHCIVCEYGPQEIKVAITGYGKSDKHAVITMVKRLVKHAPSDALDDEYDAIAVGITALANYRG